MAGKEKATRERNERLAREAAEAALRLVKRWREEISFA
jgi:hypothetical protein